MKLKRTSSPIHKTLKNAGLTNAGHSIELSTDTGENTFPIVVKKRSRCRNIIIRYQPLGHYISLTIPRHVGVKQGLDFVLQKKGWLEKQLRECGTPTRFDDGAQIPLLGNMHYIKHVGGRGVISIEGNHILVTGERDFTPRRVREWLKLYARNVISEIALEQSRNIGTRYKRISIKDTRSRWGSCTHLGELSFSWRLVLAPEHVLKYVVVHEIAHLKHMNHSPEFWELVVTLMPEYAASMRWLKRNGASLYSYG